MVADWSNLRVKRNLSLIGQIFAEMKPLSDWSNLRVKRNLSNDWLPPQSCTSVFSMVIGTSVFSKVVTSHATCTRTCTRSIEQNSEHAALRFRQEHASRSEGSVKQQRLTLVLCTCTCTYMYDQQDWFVGF